MTIKELIENIKATPDSIDFSEVIQTIEDAYHYTPTGFSNGMGDNAATNEAGSNEGSCKIFAFSKFNKLSKEQTLACFGAYYRDDVLGNPNNDDHANIRNFMQHGWGGIKFEGKALALKN